MDHQRMPRGYPNNRTKKMVGLPPEEPEQKPLPLPTPEPPESFPDRSEAKTANRFSFAVLDDNKIDLESLRSASKERLQVVLQSSLRDEDFRKFVGLSKEPEAPPAQIVSPKLIAGLFDTVSNIQAAVYSKQTGIPYAEVQKLVAWTEAEHNFLDGQGAALANKYIPPEWLKYSDITLFAVLLYTMMKQKAVIVATYQQERMKRMGVPPTEKAPEVAPPPRENSNGATPDFGVPKDWQISTNVDAGEAGRSLG